MSHKVGRSKGTDVEEHILEPWQRFKRRTTHGHLIRPTLTNHQVNLIVPVPAAFPCPQF